MKKWLKRIGIGLAVLVALLIVVEIGGRTLDPEGWAQRKKERAERRAEEKAKQAEVRAADAEKKAASKDAHRKIQQHGFAVGMTLAKSGMKKPSSDEADAMARKAALELGEDAGLGFKTVWKQMFWMGWRKGGG